MSNYTPPLRDVFFSLEDLNEYELHYANLNIIDDFCYQDMQAILPEIGKFSAEILAPLNTSGDIEGASCHLGEVKTPSGFKEAFEQYVDGGWPGLAHAEEFGGMPAPFSVKVAACEFIQASNQGWSMYTMLNDGAIKVLSKFATTELIEQYVPKLVSGEWLSTMCLTEPQCGSDLNLLKTKAEPIPGGSYKITGTKIFISSGDQDLTDNIAHLVLAKLPNAPAGTKGISLFVVPKRKINADGNLGDDNGVSCVSIEHKMGLKANSTCVMAFDGAEGWLIGEANRGLQNMFIFINKSRLNVGQQAQAQIDAAHQVSLIYAHERLQGRSPQGIQNTNKDADFLISQPDIRRMLMSQKAIAEGGRGLIHNCAKWVDIVDYGTIEQKAEAEQYLGILIPITKGCLSELASEMTDYGIQILGGHGYVTDWGLEQRVRDVRVTRIYEGTTGIQAMDLLGRKVLGKGYPTFIHFIDNLLAPCLLASSDEISHLQTKLRQEITTWREMTNELTEKIPGDKELLSAIAVDYLMIAGYITLANIWLRSAQVAEKKLTDGTSDVAFYQAKITTAKFYFSKILPRIRAHYAMIESGSEPLNCAEALQL